MLADKASRKDFNPKHRIVGAIVLASLAVIFIPMLLDKHEAPTVSPAVAQLAQIPDQNQIMVADVAPVGPATSAVATAAPATATNAAKANVAAVPAPAGKPSVAAATPAVEVPTPTSATKAITTAAAAPVVPVAAHPGKAWFVQVGTFAQRPNAEQVAHKLRTRGYPVYLEQVALSEGHAVRVRVGPYRSKDQARHMQSEIQRKAGVHGDVRAE